MKNNNKDIFIQLISDKGFRDWVLSPTEERRAFWEGWLLDNPHHEEEYKLAKSFVAGINFKEVHLSDHEKNELLLSILKPKSQPLNHNVAQVRRLPVFSQWARVAAILVFCILISVLFQIIVPHHPNHHQILSDNSWVKVDNPRGHQDKLNLEDGTVVYLNHGSSFSYPQSFEKGRRVVKLEGEAFFEVAKDNERPFIVKTGQINTHVLGTSFNLNSNAEDETVQVSLLTGKVRVEDEKRKAKKHTLQPGQQLVVMKHSGDVLIREFDQQQITAWKEGIILFNDADFPTFKAEIEKWYGVDFTVQGSPPKKWRINARFKNEELEDILNGLEFLYDVSYEKRDNRIIINFNNQ